MLGLGLSESVLDLKLISLTLGTLLKGNMAVLTLIELNMKRANLIVLKIVVSYGQLTAVKAPFPMYHRKQAFSLFFSCMLDVVL